MYMKGRTQKSFFNFASGIFSQLVILLLPFFVRQVFLQYLGKEYLGINSLLSSIIAMLNVADLGIGITLQIALYKPIAEKNKNQIIAIIQMCAKFYKIIASIIFAVGILLIPFINIFVNMNELTISKSSLQLYFLLYLINSAISYLFAYRWMILSADQNNYIISITNMLVSIVTQGILLVIIVYFHNFTLYIIITMVFTLVRNIILSYIASRKYPFLKTKEKVKIDLDIKKSIFNNTKALLFHKIGLFAITGTDNIVISKFVSLISVGMYTNYMVIISAAGSMLSQFINSLSAGIGNLLVTEDSNHVNLIFNRINFINFIFYNITTVGLYIFLNDVITLWLGKEYVLSDITVAIMVLLFFHNGISNALCNIRAQAGLFDPDKYLYIAYSVINLVISIILAIHIGIAGVVIGTLITYFIRDVIILPGIVYKSIMKVNVRYYYIMYFSYMVTTLISVIVTLFLCQYISVNNYIISLGIRFLLCIFTPTIILVIIYFQSEPFKYIMTTIKRFLPKF